jgi:uncharacterized protein (DUF486 family)
MNSILSARLTPIILLLVSNVFMTFAWYGHLKYSHTKGGVLPLWAVILSSWGIAFFEYVLMVPANRWGIHHFTATELKIIQEIITLVVFAGFAVMYLGERLKWNHAAAFLCILAAVAFTFLPARDRRGGTADGQAQKPVANRNAQT